MPDGARHRTTIRELAEYTGLSPAAVSYALRGMQVSAETEQRVRSAEELVRSRGVTTMQLELLVPQGWVHPQKARLRSWYTRLGYSVVRSAPFEQVAAQLAPRLAAPCEFLIFHKAISRPAP